MKLVFVKPGFTFFVEDYCGIGLDYDYIDWQRSAESLNALYEQRSRDFCSSKKNQIKHPAEKMVNKLRDETGLRALRYMRDKTKE